MSYVQQRHLRKTAASRRWSSSASLQSQRLSEVRRSSASTCIVYGNSRPRRTFFASAGFGFVTTSLQGAFERNPSPHPNQPQSLRANVAQFGSDPEEARGGGGRQDLMTMLCEGEENIATRCKILAKALGPSFSNVS